jgi:energy-coupling factor transporter transmembrane protein EcfT
LHPAAALVIWLSAVLAVQSLSYAGLALLLLSLFLSVPAALHGWLKFVRRARWLLLSLWLILAYGKPGEAWADLPWAPTLEGMAEANLQAVRLISMLACLAWLFSRLGREGLVSALWGVLQPLARLGLDVERLVVRLSLVLAHLQQPLPAGEWKNMLLMKNLPTMSQNVLHLHLPRWRLTDSVLVLLLMAGLSGMLWL